MGSAKNPAKLLKGKSREGNVRGDEMELKLGKGTAFDKSQLRRLRQEDVTWEADFRTLPKPLSQSATHYVGMVVTQPDGLLRAQLEIEKTPTLNDMATLLAHAMNRPLTKGRLRPRRLHLRVNLKWKQLYPALERLGIEVVTKSKLPKIEEAFSKHLAKVRESYSVGKARPKAEQLQVEQTFPAIAKWVHSYGHIEIGDEEGFGFIVRALDYGGEVFVDDRPTTLAEAMAALERGLAKWFKNEGIE